VAEERDDWIRAALERAQVPDESPSFFADLWEAAQARERAAVRRWRRVSLVLALLAAAAISSAAVLAASPAAANVVDVRGVCAAQIVGGIPVFSVTAVPSGRPPKKLVNVKPPPGFHVDPSLFLTTGHEFDAPPLFSLSTYFSGYQLDRRTCTPTRSAIALTHSALPADGVSATDKNSRIHFRCLGAGTFAFRLRIVNDKSGVPASAQVAVVRAKTGKPIVYVEWSPTRVDGWAAPSCE
jgi:hypothetical protein